LGGGGKGLGAGEEEEEEDDEWEGGWGLMDREREGWGRDPLLANVEGGRTAAEDKCKFFFSLTITSIF
jgi:hypothetical protein